MPKMSIATSATVKMTEFLAPLKNFITECCTHDHGDQPKGNRVIAQNIFAFYLALHDHRDDREDNES